MKFFVFALGLGLLQLSCSSEKSQSTAAGATVKAAHNISGGMCTHMKFSVAIPAASLDEELKEGNCPTTVEVDGESVGVVKKCDSFVKDGSTYTITFYEKNVDSEGEVFEVTEENAEASCETFETAIKDS